MSAHVERRMPDFNTSYMNHDGISYNRENNSRNEQQTESGATTPSQPQESKRRKRPKVFLDPEHNVEDVTNVSPNEEDGYDADIDSHVEYEVEEPPSDSEHENTSTMHYLPGPRTPTQASLVRDFRNLQCAQTRVTGSRSDRPHQAKRGSYSSTVHKRSHSEGELTDSDEESYASGPGRGGSAQPQRVKRRFLEPVGSSRTFSDESNRRALVDTNMDVDEPERIQTETSTSAA